MTRSRFSSFLYVLSVLLLAGCGGGGGSDSPAPTTPPAPVNNAPSISGTPATSVDEGSGYSFAPSAADADGDSLTFSVTNLPAWASFNAETGEISGTPSREHAGSYPDISISVSDGSLSRALPGFTVQVLAVRNITLAGKATDAPMVNAQVTTTVGQREFSASTDAQGNYSLPIVLRDTEYQPEDLLTLKVRGAGEQAHIELISQVVSFESLIEVAGSEEQLAAGQWHRLNLTQLSTAKYLLASDKNNGSAATTYSLLEDLEEAVDADRLQTLSGLIKLLADHAAYTVPQSKTTLSIWQDDENSTWEVAMQWLDEQGLMDTDGNYDPTFALDLQEAITVTLNDSDVVPAITDEDLIGVHIIADAPQQGYVPSSGEVLELRADGSGTAYIEQLALYEEDFQKFEFTWERQNNQLILTYPARIEKVVVRGDRINGNSFDRDYQVLADQYGFSQQLVEQVNQATSEETLNPFLDMRTIQETYSLLPENGRMSWIKGSHQVTYTLDILTSYYACQCLVNNRPVSEKMLSSSYQFYTQVDGGRPHIATDMSSGEWALPLNYTVPSAYATSDNSHEMRNYMADIMLIDGSQTSAGLSGKSVTGKVQGSMLIVTSANERYEYVPFAVNGVLYASLVNHYVDEALQQRLVRWIAKTKKPGDLDSELSDKLISEIPFGWNTVTEYSNWRSAEYMESGLIHEEFLFLYILSPDNILKFSRFDLSSVPENKFFEISEWIGWEITVDGHLSLTLSENYSYSRVRNWRLLGGDKNQYLILDERRDFNDNNNNGLVDEGEEGYLYAPRLLWLKKADLSQWQEAWANTNLD